MGDPEYLWREEIRERPSPDPSHCRGCGRMLLKPEQESFVIQKQKMRALSMIGAGLTLAFATQSNADIGADLQVDAGSTATITLAITVTSTGIEETQTQSTTVAVGGGGQAIFRPDYEPFTSADLTNLQFGLANSSLDYQFFCSSFLGCIDVNVNLANLTATLVQPSGSALDGSGRGNFNAVWNLRADYVINSSLFSGDGPIDTTSDIAFGATFNASGGDVFVNDLTLGSIASDVPDDGGVLAISLLTTVDLVNASLSGTYEVLPPASCGSSGPCGQVHGEPGCDDTGCCAVVCEEDFYCCEIQWDASCVNKAVALCGVTPTNDDCQNARPLGLGRFPFTTLNCSTEGPRVISECTTAPAGGSIVNDVWFSHTALADNGVVVSTCGHADFDTQILVYDGCDGTLVACNENSAICPDGTSLVGFMGVQGETYLIRLAGVTGAGSGEIDIAWANLDRPYEDLAVEWTVESGGNGHAYALYALGTDSTFASAVEKAARFGGYPATITSPAEQDFINRNMPGTQRGGPTAIGLIQQGGDEPGGGWSWITGEPLDWTNWQPGEPNDFATGDENYGQLYGIGTWNDNIDNFGYVLIEFDGNPALNDVVWSTDDGGNGKTYRGVVLPHRMSWTDARIYATNRGGTLACLDEPGESAWVFENIGAFASLWTMTDYNVGPWVGLFKRKGEWVWLNDEVFDGADWFPGEPNGTGDRGTCFAQPDYFGALSENFSGTPQGELFGGALYADVFGNPRLKLVADGFPGTWGTWKTPPIPRGLTAFTASFRFSFKNENSGAGDGFSMLWGDLSDTSGNRMEGAEVGVFAFQQDQQGLSVGVNSYAEGGNSGVDGRWGTIPFVQTPLEFSQVTWNDYETAGRPESMATMTVQWRNDLGLTVSIAFPFNDPQVIYSNAGFNEISGVDPTDWSFGFAARNGSIDQDVLIGDFSVTYEYQPPTGGLTGGPRNTFDDTFDDNIHRALIIEFPVEEDPCPGDLDQDGSIGGADLTLLLGAWGPCDDPTDCIADLTGDGEVNGADLSVILGGWGLCP